MSLRIVSVLAVLCALLPLQALALININTAESDALQTLNGIGPSKADAIISYREQHGPFATISDIQNVSGIGAATYANIKDHITISGGTSSAPPEPEGSSSTGGNTSSSSNVVDGRKEPEKISLREPNDELRLEVLAPERVYVHQQVNVEVIPAGIADGIVDSLKYFWSFGDASATLEGSKAQHSFAYPGEYVVVVEGKYARHEAQGRHTITVLPVELTLTYQDGSIKIHNTASSEIDVSGFVLHGASTLTMPQNTIILEDTTLSIPSAKVGAHVGSILSLSDASGSVVATTAPPPLPAVSRTVSAAVGSKSPSDSATPSSAEAAETTAIPTHIQTQNSTNAHDASPKQASGTLAYIGLVGVIAIGVLALYTRREPRLLETLPE